MPYLYTSRENLRQSRKSNIRSVCYDVIPVTIIMIFYCDWEWNNSPLEKNSTSERGIEPEIPWSVGNDITNETSGKTSILPICKYLKRVLMYVCMLMPIFSALSAFRPRYTANWGESLILFTSLRPTLQGDAYLQTREYIKDECMCKRRIAV